MIKILKQTRAGLVVFLFLLCGSGTHAVQAALTLRADDIQLVSNLTSPTQGTINFFLEVTGDDVGGSLLSYEFVRIGFAPGSGEQGTFTGASAGNLFDGLTSTFTVEGLDPLEVSEDAGFAETATLAAGRTFAFSVDVEFAADVTGDFLVSAIETADSGFFAAGGDPLDVNYLASSVTVTAIPEPSSIVILGLIGGMIAYSSRLRKLRNAAQLA